MQSNFKSQFPRTNLWSYKFSKHGHDCDFLSGHQTSTCFACGCKSTFPARDRDPIGMSGKTLSGAQSHMATSGGAIDALLLWVRKIYLYPQKSHQDNTTITACPRWKNLGFCHPIVIFFGLKIQSRLHRMYIQALERIEIGKFFKKISYFGMDDSSHKKSF